MDIYKQKYEHALDNFKKIKSANKDNNELVNFIEYEYPELKESDERIRKEILEYFHQFENEELRRINISDWIAWLEKQDPKKHEEELEKAYKTADEVQYRKGFEDAKREFEKQGEQKPAWSEEDERIRYAICDTLDRIDEHIMEYNRQLTHQQVKDWLKSLKERMKGE